MAGRRPKPTAIHKLNGNPSMMSKEELEGADNPQPELVAPELPRGLSHAARREWHRIVHDLLEIGVLSKVDGKALAAYCICYARNEEAQKDIDKYGQVIQTSYKDSRTEEIIVGDLKANPAVGNALKWMTAMKSFLIEFGLTPASRRNLKITKKVDDQMEQFLKRKSSRPATGPLLMPVPPDEMTSGSEEDKS